ncbi:MAG: hypothetical protein AAGI01_10290 [Myxococcota bacterium]
MRVSTHGTQRAESGRAAYQRTMTQLTSMPTVTLWRLGAEGLAALVTLATLLVLALPLARASVALGVLQDPLGALSSTLGVAQAWLASPELLTSVAGVVAASALLTMALRAAGDAVVWGTLGDATLGRASAPPAGPLKHATGQLTDAILWRLVRALVRTLVLGTLALTYLAVLTLSTTFAPSSLGAAVVAAVYAGAIGWSVLMIAAVEVAPAMQVVHGMRPGEALLEGMRYAMAQPMALYRLLALALIVVLPALGVYLVAMYITLPPDVSWPWEYITALMRAASQVLLIAAVTLAGVVFRGGTFWLVADEAMLAGPLLLDQATGAADRRSGILAHLGRQEGRSGRVIVEPVDLMPEPGQPQNIVTFSSVLHAEDADHEDAMRRPHPCDE